MQAELRSHIFLPESVLMNEYLFDRHVKQIGYIHCKLKRRSTSAVLNGTYGLPRYTELLHKEILPYLLLFSDLCEIVLHKSPYRTLVQLYIAILSCNQIVSSVLYVYDNHKKNLPPCDRSPWCSGPESNQGHGDFQSPALPTELPEHNGGPSWGRTKDRPVMSRLL